MKNSRDSSKKKKSHLTQQIPELFLARTATFVAPYLLVSGAGEGVLDRVGRVTTLFCAECSLVRRVA